MAAKAKAKKAPAKRGAKAGGGPRWSQHVTETSDAMDLKGGVFAERNPKTIAASLKHSAEASGRKKSGPYRSAMSMLTFYINRAGKTLSAARLRVLERAKGALRSLFGKPPAKGPGG